MDTTLSAATRMVDGNILPPVADSSASAATATSRALVAEFGKAMASANSAAAPAAAPSWLTSPDAAQAAKPHISDFMKRTGVDFLTASELMYGVVGSNVERRDWATIMSQGDPVSAARQATRALYGDTSQPARTDARYLDDATTLARQGNFALTEERVRKGAPAVQDVKLVDAQGLLLRSAGQDAATMARNAWLFGFDIADAQALIPAAQAAAPRLAAELKSAVESRGALAYAAPAAGPTASIAAALGVQPAATVAATAAEKGPMAAEAAPAISAADLLPEAQPSNSPAFSTADVMRWRQVGAEAGNAAAGNAVEALLALR